MGWTARALLAGWLVLAAVVGPASAEVQGAFAVSPGEAWKVAESVLRSLGWGIDERDRVSSVIVTDSRGVSFQDYGVYGEGLRHRLRVAIIPAATAGQTSITVRRELYREERVLWTKNRKVIESTDTTVEQSVLDAIAQSLPSRAAVASPPPAPDQAAPPPSPPRVPSPIVSPPVVVSPTPSRPAAPVPAPRAMIRTYRVTYRVSGQAASTTITYRGPRGPAEQQTTPSLPWEVSLDVPAGEALHLTASGRAQWGESSIACEILVDGVTQSRASGVGVPAVAKCDATANH